MWFDLDPELRRELEHVRRMVSLQRQTPTREWPLLSVDEHEALLVIREWPDGTITAYLAPVAR
jgi:hypothetical protein